jgi:hypothetical protein
MELNLKHKMFSALFIIALMLQNVASKSPASLDEAARAARTIVVNTDNSKQEFIRITSR